MHYWMLDVDMDRSRGFPSGGTSWFEVKSYIAGGAGWTRAHDSRREPDCCYDWSMMLPGWVVDEVESVRREVSEWRGLTPAERWRLAVLCSRDAMWAIRAHRDPRRILDRIDPVPESSVAALALLRRQAGWGRGAR